MKKIGIENINETKEKIIHRVNRIEGQIRGIKKMIEEGQSCPGIMNQISAVRQAVAMLGTEILENEFICKFERGEKITKKDLENLLKIKQ